VRFVNALPLVTASLSLGLPTKLAKITFTPVRNEVDPTADFAQLQLGFVDQTQRRYEVIRPLVLFADRTVVQRARETQTHPDTVRKLRRRFQHQGMRGLMRIQADTSNEAQM
jgi:hypothetical protein